LFDRVWSSLPQLGCPRGISNYALDARENG